MKKWIYTLICLGYFTATYATDHASFLVTGEDIQEMKYYDHILETPNFFTRIYPENLNPNLVLIPRTNSGFNFGVMGFYQRPFDNQLDYTISDPVFSLFSISRASTIKALDPDYEFGYGAYLGYIHPYMGRDVRLEAFNFTGDADDATTAPPGSRLWTPLALYDATNQALHAIAHLGTDVEQAKLMIGQYIFGGTRFHLHPALGVKYASINRELDTTYENAFSFGAPIGTSHVEQKNRFSGLGPAVQVDGKYFFTPRFGLVGHLTSAILSGKIRSEIRYVDEQIPPDSAAINLKSTDRAVPNLDGQLGLLFHHPFCGSHTALDIEVGYEFNHFFNAIDTYRSTGERPFTPFHVKHVHDFTLDGPYFSIGISGIACPSDVVIDPIMVTVPRLEGGFIFGVGAGYFSVSHNQQDYALLDPTAFSITPVGLATPTLNGTLRNVEVDYAYGLMLTAGYVFGGSPYDIQAHYRQTTAKDSDTTFAPSTGGVWTILSTPLFDAPNSRAIATDAKANISFNFHDGNVEFGQTINADSLIWLRIFGGVQFASINSNFHTTYNNVQNFNVFSPIFPEENIVQKSNFSGFGPRLGFDMTLPVLGFGLSSQLAGGFLLGSIDSSYKDEFPTAVVGEDTFPGGVLGTRIDSETKTSPFVTVKVGLAYTWNFFTRTKWTLDLGYMATQYFNAATTFRHLTNNAAVYAKQVHDVNVAGPYLNLTIFGFGGCPPDCIIREPYPAFAPILRGGFEFAAEGLYLRAHAANLDFAIVDPAPVSIPAVGIPTILPLNPSSLSKMRVIPTDYEFGYRLHLGYIFPLSANDVSINFTDYKASAFKSVVAPPGGVIWTITNGNASDVFNVALFPFPVLAARAEASADFTWQSGNLELGRRLKFYQLMTRFFAGVSYARIIEDITITYADGQTVGSVTPIGFIPISSDVLTQRNSFYGIGPRLGAAADLALGCGFSIIGQAGTDLLVGNIDTGLLEESSSGASTALNPDRRTRLVPAVDAKLGLAFTVPLRDCAQVGLEIGYQANHYFNVKDSLRFSDNFSTFLKQDQDISFDGPYVRLQINI